MKKRLALAGMFSLAWACTPSVPKGTTAPSGQVHARFDPAATPAVVPSPNDLAISTTTHTVTIPLPPNASGADKELQAYFAGLDGFSAASAGSTTFDGNLDPSTVNAQNVLVWDVTSGSPVPVSGYVPGLRSGLAPPAVAEIDVTPPMGGWTPGHDYAVVLVGGPNGLKSADGGTPVIGTPTWALIRSTKPLVNCQGMQCVPATNLIPSSLTDPAARIQDQTQKAMALEQLREQYAPLFQAAELMNIPRANIPLLWTFRIASVDMIAYTPTGPVPTVPSPNDLAINPTTHLVNAPVDPRTPAAAQEFTRTYVNTLNGFPLATDGTAQVVGPNPLAAGKVTTSTVLVTDLTPAADGGMATPPAVTVAYLSQTNQIVIVPPGGSWSRGHQYAAAIVGGSGGITDSNGGPVYPDVAWVLLRGSSPLVDCTTLSSACHSVVTAIPLSDADAVALETVRRGLAPVLAGFEAAGGVPASSILAAWTFTILSSEEVTFDPANSVIPFPNDLLRVAPDAGAAHVNLPLPTLPDGGVDPTNPQVQLVMGLNTLDGFSTTAPIVTQNSTTQGTLTDGGQLDPSTLAAGAHVVKLMADAGYSSPVISPCLSDALGDGGCSLYFSMQTDGGLPTYPEQLVLAPAVPLDERTPYAAYLTTDLKDTSGKNVAPTVIFALLRLSNPLVDSTGHSTVPGVTDTQAAQLEPLRQGMQPLFMGLAAAGVPTSKLALAWAFTTQSEISVLQQLHAAPSQLPAGFGYVPGSLMDLGGTAAAVNEVDAGGNFPYGSANISRLLAGEVVLANLLTGTGGTLNPGSPAPEKAFFTLTIPDAGVPTNGFPVAIFGHGLNQWRNNVTLIADRLAQSGIATIAVDDVLHGDRSSCTGATAVLPVGVSPCATGVCDSSGKCSTVGGTLPCTTTVPAGQTPDYYCFSNRQGFCDGASGRCTGGDLLRDGDTVKPPPGADPFGSDGRAVISGWNFLNTANLFATRDNFRQTTVDYATMAGMIAASGSTSLNSELKTLLGASGAVLNPGQIYYLGQSLGGITGTLYSSVAPEAHNVLLNVPGGDLPNILLMSPDPAFQAVASSFLSTVEASGAFPGTIAFDQFIRTVKWILDPADPINMGYGVANAILPGPQIPADRHAFIYWIQNDGVVPNLTTEELIAAANRPGANQCQVKEEMPSETTAPSTPESSNKRHGFLLVPPGTDPSSITFTLGAQAEAAAFLSTGTAP